MSGVTIDNPPAFFMEHFDSIKSEFQFLGEDKGFGHNLKHLLSDVRDTHPAYKLSSGDTAKCVTPAGRRIIFCGTPVGPFMIYEYREEWIAYEGCHNFDALHLASSGCGLSCADIFRLLGMEDGRYGNIGQRLEGMTFTAMSKMNAYIR